MIIFIVGILLIAYSILKKDNYSPWIGMLFVLLIMGFQDGVKGDLFNYRYSFITHSEYSVTVKENEFVFRWIFNNLRFLPFNLLIFFISVIQYIILCFLIKDYSNKRYKYSSAILFFFTFGCMLLQMKALRQGWAIEMAILAFILLDKRRYILSLLALLIMYGLHNSSLIMLPFYILFYFYKYIYPHIIKFFNTKRLVTLNKRNNNLHIAPAILLSAICLCLFIFKQSFAYDITNILFMMDSEYLGYFESYNVKPMALWVLLCYMTLAFFISLYMFQERNKFQKLTALFCLFSYYIYILVWGLGDQMRIAQYFIVFSIVVYPNVALFIRRIYGKWASIAFLVFCVLFSIIPSISPIFNTHGNLFGTYRFSFM